MKPNQESMPAGTPSPAVPVSPEKDVIPVVWVDRVYGDFKRNGVKEYRDIEVYTVSGSIARAKAVLG